MVESASAQQQPQLQKPNILVIMGDDIGYWNISAYNRGMMGYRTPNIMPSCSFRRSRSWRSIS
jgi:arylsulfatase